MKLEMMEPVVKKFYEGLAEGKFYARRCRECGAVEFPPHLACNAWLPRDRVVRGLRPWPPH